METRIVIAGSRSFNDYSFFSSAVNAQLTSLKEHKELGEIIILSGHCSGVDLMAERYAREHGLKTEIFPADWRKYGRSAGPRRNAQMVEIADFAIAFPAGGPGTRSLINLAIKKGIPVQIFQI